MNIEIYKHKIDLIKNNSNFSIPIEIYSNNLYCKERRRILLLISSIFQNNKEFKKKSKKSQNNIIIDIELSCYNSTVNRSNELLIYINWDNTKFIYLYQLFCNKITKNLDILSEVGENYLIDKILNDEIDIKNIADMQSDKLCPAKSENIKQKLILRNSQKLNYKTSTLYTCKNCGKKEVIIRMVQIKSCDEGQSIGLKCVFCAYNWVVS
jgi:DNA-directed RNA polymerase subunit M/transcription elongation factor TFIIS